MLGQGNVVEKPRRPGRLVITDAGDGRCQGSEYHLRSSRGKPETEGKIAQEPFLCRRLSPPSCRAPSGARQLAGQGLPPPRAEGGENSSHCP